MKLKPDVVEAIKRHAIEQFPRESCGLIVGVRAPRYVPCDNSAADPTNTFRIDPRVYARAGKVRAVVHSHPGGNAWPSMADMQGQMAAGIPWGVLSTDGVNAGDIVWWGDKLPVPDLIGREFVHGVTDCYSLIRDYYRLERGIVIPDFPRDDEWWTTGGNLYVENFAAAGFRRIEMAEAREGDVFLAHVRSPVPNHGGIVLGDGLILHHLANRLSRREPGGRWLSYVSHFLRYGHD